MYNGMSLPGRRDLGSTVAALSAAVPLVFEDPGRPAFCLCTSEEGDGAHTNCDQTVGLPDREEAARRRARQYPDADGRTHPSTSKTMTWSVDDTGHTPDRIPQTPRRKVRATEEAARDVRPLNHPHRSLTHCPGPGTD